MQATPAPSIDVRDPLRVAQRFSVLPGLVERAARFVANAAHVAPVDHLTLQYLDDDALASPHLVGGASLLEPEHAWISLGQRWASDLQLGIDRLEADPFATWSPPEQDQFVRATSTLLHEVGHVTLPSYDDDAIAGLPSNRPPRVNGARALEEGLTQIVATEDTPRFLREAFGISLTNQQVASLRADSVGYWGHVTAIKGLLELGGKSDGDAIDAARVLADQTAPQRRFEVLARWIATQHAAPADQARVARRVEALLPGIVSAGRFAPMNGTKLERLLAHAELARDAG